jgi:ankyrin repeat protein
MASLAPQELEASSSGPSSSLGVSSLPSDDSDKIVIPALSELVIDDGLIPVDHSIPRQNQSVTTDQHHDEEEPVRQEQSQRSPVVLQERARRSPPVIQERNRRPPPVTQERMRQSPPAEPFVSPLSAGVQPISIDAAFRTVPPHAAEKQVVPELAAQGHGIQEAPPPVESFIPKSIRVDRFKIVFRKPKSSASSNSTSLQNTLVSAVENRKHKVAEQLLDRGVSPDTSPKVCVVIATRNEDMDMLKLLLEFGADPDGKQSDGATALGTACWGNGNEPFVKILLNYGADVNLPGAHNIPPIQAAFRLNRPDIVTLLLAAGRDPNEKLTSNHTPLEWVCENIMVELAKLLVAYGADVNLKGFRAPLYAAVRSKDCVEFLLSNGVDLAKNPEFLEEAVRGDHMETVKFLLSKGADINHHGFDRNRTPLGSACQRDNPEMVTLLLSYEANPNVRGLDGSYPISFAKNSPKALRALLAAKNIDIQLQDGLISSYMAWSSPQDLELIIQHGADVNKWEPSFAYPIHTAVRLVKWDMFQVLLRHDVDVNVKRDGVVPLESATGNPKFIKPLLEAGADISLCPSIIKNAAFHGHVEAIRILVELTKIDINTPDPRDNHTALTSCALHGREAVLDTLFELGADVNRPGSAGKSALVWAANSNPKIIKRLMAAGANPEQLPEALQRAIKQGNIDCTRELLDACEDVSAISGLVVMAVIRTNLELVTLLLEKGANANDRDDATLCALYRAVEKERQDLVDLLLTAGADPNLAVISGSFEGRTPLMEACQRGKMEMVKTLLKHGANIETKKKDGKTAIDIAAGKGYDEIVILLLDGE